MDFYTLIKERYSCKKYSDKRVSDELLQKILAAGNAAPTAKNQQSQRIYVANNDDALEKIDKVTPCRYGAQTVLLFTYNKNEVYIYPGEEKNTGMEDVSIVATHIMLAAANECVNSCWVNNFDIKETRELFNIPDEEDIVLLMDIGYAAEGAGPLANHEKSKELSETVRYL